MTMRMLPRSIKVDHPLLNISTSGRIAPTFEWYAYARINLKINQPAAPSATAFFK
jgi:hypothetical protein